MKAFKKLQAASILAVGLSGMSITAVAGWENILERAVNGGPKTRVTVGINSGVRVNGQPAQKAIDKAVERYEELTGTAGEPYIVAGNKRYKNGSTPLDPRTELPEYNALVTKVETDYRRFMTFRKTLVRLKTSILRRGGDLNSEESERALRSSVASVRRYAIMFDHSLSHLNETTEAMVTSFDKQIDAQSVNFIAMCNTARPQDYQFLVTPDELIEESKLCSKQASRNYLANK